MSTLTTISTQFEDPTAIVEDLLRDIPEGAATDTVAFLFCDSQQDVAAIYSGINDRTPFPVVGGTALGFPFTAEDGGDICAALMVIRKPGLKVSVAVCEPLDQASYTDQMRDVYSRCRNALGEKPKMVLPFFPLIPGLPTGLFIAEIFGQAKDVPVFGGITTNNLVDTRAAIFADGNVLHNAMVLVMLAGDIQPVFSAGNTVSPMVDYAPVVTKSEANEVFEVDNGSFCEYMRTLGLHPEDRINGVDALMQYGPTPVIAQSPDWEETDIPVVRCISFTDLSRNSAMFSGPMPVRTRLRMSILRLEDIASSTAECLEKLVKRMEPAQQNGYEYTALFCISCVARYFVMAGNANIERQILMEQVPHSLSTLGFYAFCEIAPGYSLANNHLVNQAHSASVTLCAL